MSESSTLCVSPLIFKALVRVGDKPPTFVGSKTWIGSQELFLVMGELYKVKEVDARCYFSDASFPGRV